MGPRGKQKNFKNKRNVKNKPKSKERQRKTYTLYQNKNKDQFPSNNKRKAEFHQVKPNNGKQKKIEKPPQIEAYSSSSEEEIENNMKLLLDTFDKNLDHKKSLAIDSSDDSMSVDEDINQPTDEIDEQHGSNNVSDSNSDNENINEHDDFLSNSKAGNTTTTINTTSKSESRLNTTLDDVDECEIDAETQHEDENLQQNLEDPFAKHLFYEMGSNLLNSVQSTPMKINTAVEDWPTLGKVVMQIPFSELDHKVETKFSIAEAKQWAPLGTIPEKLDRRKHTLQNIHIKSQILNNVAHANKPFLNSVKEISADLPLTSLQSEIFSIINNYQDFYYPYRTLDNGEQIRFIYTLHVVNHILKTRTKVLHHNARLTKKDEVPEEFRDQGLVRPKILIVVPFRDAAFRIINMLIDILITEDKGNVLNKNRYLEEFTGHELAIPKKNPKPEDYEQTFSGNTGDDFKIGITVTKKSLKLFADFYSSDIIIASPLGLRTIIGAEGEPDRDYDFLASVELLILDQTEIFMMQNWDHVLHIFNHLHLQPKESHGTNFSRVRTWSLNGWSKYYRQTLIFSSINLPDFNAIFNKRCYNYAGKIKVVNLVEMGAICKVFNQLPHVFHKFSAESASEAIDSRFQFFINKILPQQRDTLMKQTLIFISNYFDYVRLRNYFKREDIGFVQICEYSKEGKVARARDMFFHGDAHFLLYTERHHFFNRIRIKGIRHLVFYQPPIFPHFYYEMCNLMQEGNMNRKIGNTSNMTVTVIYSKYDVNQLTAIVGTERASKMLQSDRSVHMFVTDGKQNSKGIF